MTSTDTSPQHDPAAAEAKGRLAEQLVSAATGAMEIAAHQIGFDLGLYAALRSQPATPGQLAERTGIHPRYAQEWLEQQYAAGVVDVDDVSAAPEARRFHLPPAHAQVLLDGDDPDYAGALVPMATGVLDVRPAVVDAFRTGGGVPFSAYGAGIRHGIGAANRPVFLNILSEWLARAGVAERLAGLDEPVIADIGCGVGWSTIHLARQVPHARVVGVDLDPASVADARTNVAAEGLSSHVAIRCGDAARLDGGPFDLVTVFEMLHDSADPVGVLAAARRSLAPGGEVLLADEATADEFGSARGELLERFQYGCSVLHCLPATMAEGPVEATGTVIRQPTIRRYAAEAGFTTVEEVDVTPGFFRVYLLK